MYKFGIGDCVQFNEKHKWFPGKGAAYIFTMESANEIEFVGQCIFMPVYDDEK